MSFLFWAKGLGSKPPGGYSSECAKKRNAAKQWQDTIDDILRENPNARPDALVSGDNCYPPNLGQHPPCPYSSGRVVVEPQRTTQTSRIPQGPLHPAADMSSDVWGGNPWGSDAIPVEPMPKATPSHGPKRARTDARPDQTSPSGSQHVQHRRRNRKIKDPSETLNPEP